MWQVQYDVGGDNRFEVELNTRNLAYGVDEENGRFTLYPTNNTYNFILLDQKKEMYGKFNGHMKRRRGLY